MENRVSYCLVTQKRTIRPIRHFRVRHEREVGSLEGQKFNTRYLHFRREEISHDMEKRSQIQPQVGLDDEQER